MERLKNTKVIQRANLFYDFNGKSYLIGTISKEFLTDRLIYAYVFDIDKEAVDNLKKIDSTVTDSFIPGIELDEYGYYQAFSKLPFFISMRVMDRRRTDEHFYYYLKMYNMTEYDEFTFFLRSQGRSEDNFHVEEVSVD